MNCDTIKWKAYYRVYQIKDLCSQKFNIYKFENATNKDIQKRQTNGIDYKNEVVYHKGNDA